MAYKIVILFTKEINMKEIGLKLKLKREENGVSLEEAAADLKMKVQQLSSIEEGRKEDFKDIFALKYFIRDYAKYLGLDGEEILDEFNEYLFEQTSKISVEDIDNAKKAKEIREKNMKVLSPYTVTKKSKKKVFIIAFLCIFVAFLVVIGYFIISNHQKDEFIHQSVSYRVGE